MFINDIVLVMSERVSEFFLVKKQNLFFVILEM